MGLSETLASEFVKVTKDKTSTVKETTAYGIVVEYNGQKFVKLDGSDVLTPATFVTHAEDGERVTVLIKQHTATVNGNITSPSVRDKELSGLNDEIGEFKKVISYEVVTDDLDALNARINNLVAIIADFQDITAVNAEIEALRATFLDADFLSATDIEAINASIEHLRASCAEIENLSVEDLEAINASIDNLKAYVGEFTYVSTETLDAVKANIKTLETEKLDAESANLKYANIDFSNIGKAAMEYFYAQSGLIENVTIGDATITGNLVGVTIKGDLIEGGTVVADKLVIKGQNGLYYKLNTDGMSVEAEQTEYNSLNGSVITAKSITATKISVSDLVAFDATIGGFHITDNSIYSGVKETISNTTRGIYLDNDGQMAFGDAFNFVKFYHDEGTDTYKLAISAESIMFSSTQKNIETVISDLETQDAVANTKLQNQQTFIETFSNETSTRLSEHESQISDINSDLQDTVTKINKYIKFDENGIELGEGASALKLRIDNDRISFLNNNVEIGYWDGVNFYTGNITVRVDERAQFGNFAFIPRNDESLMFMKVGG